MSEHFNRNRVGLYDLLFKLANNEGDWRAFDNSFKPPYPMDIWYNKEFLTIEIPILDGNLDAVKIVTTNDEIAITRSAPNEDMRDRVYEAKGIVKRPFAYKWKVSSKFDLSKLVAEYKNGLLIVSIPYAEAALPKEINILNHDANWKKVALGEPLDGDSLESKVLDNFKNNIDNR